MPHQIATVWGKTRECNVDIDPGWTLVGDNVEGVEKTFARHDEENKSINIMRIEGKRGWGGLKQGDDEWNEAFIAGDSYPCGELDKNNPAVINAFESGAGVEKIDDFNDEGIAEELFNYGYNHRSQENLPVFDNYDAVGNLSGSQLDKLWKCGEDHEDCSFKIKAGRQIAK